MEQNTSSQPQWSAKGLLGLLRSSLPPAVKPPVVQFAKTAESNPPPERLDSRELAEVANEWRRRTAEGDQGAESVAAALDMLATRRAQEKRPAFQSVGKRLSQLMQLS